MVDLITDLPDFADDLVLILLGPGTGESVLVRWPPDHWLVIDSFRRAGRPTPNHPALKLLTELEARPDAVVLTHPHDDHTNGLGELIARRRPEGLVGWWAVGERGPKWDTANPSVAARQGANEQAVSAIDTAWRSDPACKWELRGQAGAVEIGGAQIHVLAPLAATVEHHKRLRDPDPNELSSAMHFSWEGCRLLLGADLVTLRGWASIAALEGEMAYVNTHAIKVAHHGSGKAQHTVALGVPPKTTRLHLGTPYGRGDKVPRFEDGRDVATILEVAERLYMSAHNGVRPHGSATLETRRSDLLPAPVQLGQLEVVPDAPSAPLEHCWLAARWDRSGTLISVDRGPGTVCVVP